MVDSVDAAIKSGMNFPDSFQDMPVMDWEKTRDGHGVRFMAARRTDDDTVWVWMGEMIFPDLIQVSDLMSTASQVRYRATCLTRWHTPVDDENCVLFGWRHFNDEIDPNKKDDPDCCGYDKLDFLDG